MAEVSTTLNVTIRLTLSGNLAYTTQALTDPPAPEVTSLTLERLELERWDRTTRAPRMVNLTPQSAHEDRYLRFIENLLTALNGEAEEALLEAGE